MRRLLLAIFAAGALAVPVRASAQVTQSDSAAVLLGVATRLRAEGRNAMANSLLDLIVERYGNTPSAAEARALRAQQSRVQEEGSGKTELLVWSTTYGLALGVLTPVAFGVDDPEVYGLGLIAGGPAGFLIGRSILKQRPVSEGQARAISFGTLWGAWQGYAIAEILDLDDRDPACDFDPCYYGPQEDGEVLLRASLLGSVAGLAGGLYLSRKPIPAGTATAVNFGAFWGTWYGTVVNILMSDEDGESDRGITLAALGGNAGLLFTALTAPRMQLSVARARLISITGVAGLLAGFGILLVANPDDISNEAILVPALTSALGLGLGAYWTRDYDERSRGGGDGGDGGALLERRADSWKLGLPEPGIRALEIRRNGRPAFAPGLSVSLFKARF